MEKRHVVIIEWGGTKPPGQWYRSLVRLASLDVRFDPARIDSAADVLAQHGVVLQEGVIMCESYSLARTIASLAETGLVVNHKDGDSEVFKPKTVLLAEFHVEDFRMTTNDRATLGRMRAVFGKRGNPGKAADYAVTCFEELTTHYATTTNVVNCPHCLATNVRWRAGDPNRFADPGGDLLFAWARMRFATGKWEPSLDGEELPPETIHFNIAAEKEFVESLATAPILEQIASVDRSEAMRLLDAAFVARLYCDDTRRTKARMEAVAELWQQQAKPDSFGVNVSETGKIDLLDASLFDSSRVAELFNQWQCSRATAKLAAPAEKSTQFKNFVPPKAPVVGSAYASML